MAIIPGRGPTFRRSCATRFSRALNSRPGLATSTGRRLDGATCPGVHRAPDHPGFEKKYGRSRPQNHRGPRRKEARRGWDLIRVNLQIHRQNLPKHRATEFTARVRQPQTATTSSGTAAQQRCKLPVRRAHPGGRSGSVRAVAPAGTSASPTIRANTTRASSRLAYPA